jgi:hypothetical protein
MKKTLKRLLVSILVLALLTAVIPAALAAEGDSDKESYATDLLTDAMTSSLAADTGDDADTVDAVITKGWFGLSKKNFEPAAIVSRELYIFVLWRFSGSPHGVGQSSFTDIPQGAYYSEALAWAQSIGLVNGTGGGAFKPEADISRQDSLVIVKRYLDYLQINWYSEEEKDNLFTDDGEISDYAKEALKRLANIGMITVGEDGKIAPRGYVTRLEFARILLKLNEKSDGEFGRNRPVQPPEGVSLLEFFIEGEGTAKDVSIDVYGKFETLFTAAEIELPVSYARYYDEARLNGSKLTFSATGTGISVSLRMNGVEVARADADANGLATLTWTGAEYTA